MRLDFIDLDDISSGLRTLLIILKRVESDNMDAVNLKAQVREIFETTGFAELLLE